MAAEPWRLSPRASLPDAGTAKLIGRNHHRRHVTERAKLAIIPWGTA